MWSYLTGRFIPFPEMRRERLTCRRITISRRLGSILPVPAGEASCRRAAREGGGKDWQCDGRVSVNGHLSRASVASFPAILASSSVERMLPEVGTSVTICSAYLWPPTAELKNSAVRLPD